MAVRVPLEMHIFIQEFLGSNPSSASSPSFMLMHNSGRKQVIAQNVWPPIWHHLNSCLGHMSSKAENERSISVPLFLALTLALSHTLSSK